MASDSRGDSRRKHRRSPSSSDEEVERTSKRHKHRHRHRRSSKRHEEDMKERDEDVCSSPPPTPLPPPPPSVAAPNSTPDDDLEEGEILEEEGLNSDEGKVSGQSKIQNLGDDVGNDTVPEEVIAAGTGSNEKTEDFCPSTDGIENGGFGGESHKDSQQQRKPSSFHKGNDNQNRHSDVDSGESRDSALSGRGKSSRSSGKRYEELQLSPSRESCRNGVYIEKNTNSVDYVRERSHSQSTLLDDDIRPKAIHRGESESYYAEKSRADYDSDDRRSDYYGRDHRYDSYHAEKSRVGYDSDVQRKDRRGRDNRHDSRDYVRSEGREESENYSKYSRREEVRYHSRERDAHSEQRREEREKWRDVETDRDYRKRRDRERSIGRDNRARDRDMEQERRRDDRRGASRDRGNDMDRRRERERSVDYAIDRDKDRHRDRSKEKVRERSKDRTRDSKRERYREREIKDDGRNADRERQRNSEKWHSDNKTRDHDRDVEGDRTKYGALKGGHDNLDRYKRPKHSGRDGLESHQDKSRKEDLEKVRALDSDLSEGGERKPNSDKDERQDMDESITFDLTLNEEEDIEKIKEESRRRRQAIMDKYKNKQQVQKVQQQDVETAPEDLGKGLPTESVTAAANLIPGSSGGSEGRDTDHSFSVGKSPQTNGSDAHDTTGAGGLGEGSPKSERSEDMFYDDIFGESPAGVRKLGKGGGLHVERSGLHDNWDDAEGYYSYRFGEILDGRYEVIAAHGKGVFSTVVRAKDLKAGSGEPQEVAVKILRNKEAMYKAGVEELGILNKLVGADPDDKRHCVRLLSSFKYRNHLCLVFESLSMNLREVLKKFGRNIGLKLTAVRAYAKQLFIALKHLRNCGVLHCDIKPDNMLVNEAKNVLKLCDFGNAMYAGKNEITPYLVSRFYRAPEIILGLPYDHPMDIWSVGCSLYELYTGKVLFPGPSNNDMLRLHMELKGPVPKKMLRKGGFVDRHFDQDLNFLATEEDPVTKKSIKRMILNIKPKDIGTIIKGSPGEDPKMLANFKDLLDKIFVLDPEKRMTVQQALNHPFITGK